MMANRQFEYSELCPHNIKAIHKPKQVCYSLLSWSAVSSLLAIVLWDGCKLCWQHYCCWFCVAVERERREGEERGGGERERREGEERGRGEGDERGRGEGDERERRERERREGEERGRGERDKGLGCTTIISTYPNSHSQSCLLCAVGGGGGSGSTVGGSNRNLLSSPSGGREG